MQPWDDAVGRERRAALHEEIHRLPREARAAIVLCDLQGLSLEEAARRLQWPRARLARRLARGRDRLESRMSRRGFHIPHWRLTAECAGIAQTRVSGRLLEAAVAIAARVRCRIVAEAAPVQRRRPE